jgi:kynurenine formamidase
MRIIDLSLAIEPNEHDPMTTTIEWIDHGTGGDMLGRPAGLDRSAFPDSLGLSLEIVHTTTHVGTHVDAPAHYGPLCEGRPARTIDELPLEWFFADGVVIDCRDPSFGDTIGPAELETKLAAIGHQLSPGEIVLLMTGADRLWGTAEYFRKFRGVGREGTAWLVEAGIRVIGIDTFGFDPPFETMLAAYKASGRREFLWPSHIYGREREYCQIERLANLDAIPVPYGFKVVCFPIKVQRAGAGWSRVVAIVS